MLNRLVPALLGVVLSVYPFASFEPATLRIKVKSDVGVTIIVVIDDETFYRRTDVPVSDHTELFFWHDVPAGEHEVHALAVDNSGNVLSSARAPARVLPRQ